MSHDQPSATDERAAFEKWLGETMGLESEWEPERNCYKEFPAHIAWKAWQAHHKPSPSDYKPGATPKDAVEGDLVLYSDYAKLERELAVALKRVAFWRNAHDKVGDAYEETLEKLADIKEKHRST